MSQRSPHSCGFETKVIRIKKDKIKVAKKYHEEIKRVDNYTGLELDSFFANRYKK